MQASNSLSADMVAEMNFLALYSLDSRQEGLKLHKDAAADLFAAAQRLYDKGIISQQDGGYLTDHGIEVAEYLQHLICSLE